MNVMSQSISEASNERDKDPYSRPQIKRNVAFVTGKNFIATSTLHAQPG
jgi:hypothetical protein